MDITTEEPIKPIVPAWVEIFMWTLGVFIIFFNGLLMFVLLKSETMKRQRFNMIMISLAFSDFMVGVLVPFTSLRIGRWAFS